MSTIFLQIFNEFAKVNISRNLFSRYILFSIVSINEILALIVAQHLCRNALTAVARKLHHCSRPYLDLNP